MRSRPNANLLVTANAAVLDVPCRSGDHRDHSNRGARLRVLSIHSRSHAGELEGHFACWLLGQPLSSIAAGQEADTLQFVEGGLVYRLPWAMEAIRVRGIANG